MNTLQIRQIRRDGSCKTWKLNEPGYTVTFGMSRKAHLLSIDSQVSAYQLAFECHGKDWRVTSFDQQTDPPTRLLKDGDQIELSDSTLHFQLIRRTSFLSQKLLSHLGIHGDCNFLVVISRHQQIVSTHLLTQGLTYEHSFAGEKVKFDFTQKTSYEHQGLKFSLISANKVETKSLLKEKSRLNLKSSETRTHASLMGFTLLLIVISWLVPQAKTQLPVITPPPQVVGSVVRHEIQRNKKGRPSSLQMMPTSQQSSGGGSTKSVGLLKGQIGARISHLIGKVSATEARSKNVVLVAQGIKAGHGPSGRALAALGNTNQNGRDWNGGAISQGTAVGTAGRGGGRGTGQIGGSLAQGQTGQGGIGLIEDESEIVGGLDREVIAQYIKTQLGQILYCYERQLSASPDLYGKIAVKFTIAGTGRVETQSINDTTLKNRSVENCILNKIAQWKFPEPRGGTKVLVTYPFLFKSTN